MLYDGCDMIYTYFQNSVLYGIDYSHMGVVVMV